MSTDMQDWTVVVTGGNGGIGRATLDAFRARGASTWSLDLAEPEAGENSHRFAPVDVSDAKAVRDAVDRIAAETGRLDVVVAGAGINRDAVFWKLTPEQWNAVLRVNLDGSLHLLQASLPHFRAAGKGAAVLIASINGERGWFGQANYSASKAGVIALGRTAAQEAGRFGVRVNIVSPGYIDTDMTRPLPEAVVESARQASPLGRIGQPAEVAEAILFLASDQASYITGQVLRVDGGQLS